MDHPKVKETVSRENKSYCEICGDKARGCNFDAITCASCKEFFRRNALKEKSLKCYFQGSCTIDIVSRRFCAACRLKKCFSVGMKKEYIMSEDERTARKTKIKERKQRHVNGVEDYSDKTVAEYYSRPFTPQLTFNFQIHNSQISLQAISRSVLSLENNFNRNGFGKDSNSSSDSNEATEKQTHFDAKKQTLTKSEKESLAEIMRRVKVIRENYILPYEVLRENAIKELTSNEKLKLSQLVSSVHLMQYETVYELPLSERFVDLVRITEIITRMLIKMCKMLTGFQNLSQEDQIALLKGGCMETLLIRSIMTINLEKECWESLDLERNLRFCIRLDLLKQSINNLYEAHRKYAMSFKPEWRFDENIMSLLVALTIFNPERTNIVNPENVRAEQESYMNLLRKYLETIYPKEMAKANFAMLMKQLQYTRSISEVHVRAYFEVDPSEVGQLLIEIFDLNINNNMAISFKK